MRIGLLKAMAEFEMARARPGAPAVSRSLIRHELTLKAVRKELEAEGHQIVEIPVDYEIAGRLREYSLDIVFNTYFGPSRRQDQAYVSSLMDFIGVPYTGGDSTCHFLGLSKPFTKRLLADHGIPTPRFFEVAGRPGEALETDLEFPVIVKAPFEGEGLGLDEGSVARTPEGLETAVRRILLDYGGPALVEEFIEGREFTVGVLGNREPEVLPVLELEIPEGGIYSYEVKLKELAEDICPAPIPDELRETLGDLAIRAGRAIRCRDYWRVDFRVDENGNPFVLEVNTLPGLQPGYSDLPKMAEKAGLSYGELVRRILDLALERIR